jgi:CheY-like chemotaxis protein
VLLVEDNPLNRRLALEILNEAGVAADIAENGEAGVAAVQKTGYSVVLMDVQMPVMDGLEVTAAIRAREQTSGGHLPIIAITAHAMQGDEERCLAAGMDGYVAKPVAADELKARLQAGRRILEAHDRLIASRDRLRDQAEKMHQKVAELAEKAQVEHDSMVKLFANSDEVRKGADDLQAKFVAVKVQADAVHKEYIASVNTIHEIETSIHDLFTKDTEQRKAAETSSSMKLADEIFDKFKRGEKLSTEDLMTLQKAGLL